jgi:WD40 repeat protein
MTETPYVGLVPYREADADFFFGRDEEIRIIAGNFRSSRLTIVYGPSGVGKTSVIEAGVIHALRRRAAAGRGSASAICSFRAWRDDPLPGLMETIRAGAGAAVGADIDPWRSGEPPVETLRAWTRQVRTILVVLDQFEEYFLYHGEDDGDGTFASAFAAIVNDPNLRVNFLLSIREDAWAKLDRFEGRIPRLFANYVRVDHLNRSSARHAIDGPIEEWNRRLPAGEPRYTLEPALAEAVIDAAAAGGLARRDRSDRPDRDLAAEDEVEAPFLQLVMERLWRATVDAGGRDLTLARLEQLGGAQRIVENHLLDALGALDAREQDVASDAFRFLVTRSRTKIAHDASDLAEWTKRPEPEMSAVLEQLTRGESGRVLRRVPRPPGASEAEGDGDGARYELFHDVLADPILEWRRDHEQERARRAALRRFARIGAVLLALAAFFAALGAWALVQRSDARRATRTASSLALASAASAQLPKHAEVSLLLGLEGYRESPTADAASALVAALENARRSGVEAVLHGDRALRTVAFSPDGRTVAGARFDGALQLWDVRARRRLGPPLRGHRGEVWSVAFSPDGHTLASSGHDHTIRLWSVDDRRQARPPLRRRDVVRSVAWSPDGDSIAFGSDDGTVRLWPIARGSKSVRTLGRANDSAVWSIAFSRDGHTIAAGDESGAVRLLDTRRGRRVQAPLRRGAGAVAGLAFSPDGRTLAGGDLDGKVQLWDVRRRQPLDWQPAPVGDQVWSVAFSGDGRTLAASDFGGTVRLWDLRARRRFGKALTGHSGRVDGVAFAPRGQTLVSAAFDGTIRVWNARHRVRLGRAPLRSRDRIKSVAFGPDGRSLAAAGWDGRVRVLDLDARPPRVRQVPGAGEALEAVAVSADGSTLAAAGHDGAVQLWNARTLRRRAPLAAGVGPILSVALGPDGRTLAAAGDLGVRLWDLASRKELATPLRGDGTPGRSVAFSADGRTLALAASDSTARLWDVDARKPAGAAHSPDGVQSVALSPDGRTLAFGTVNGAVRLWDRQAHKLLGELRARGRVESLAFSSDGRTLAAAGSDEVRLWDVRSRTQLGRALAAHHGSVFAVAFSPDGRTFASAGADGRVRLWEGILWRDFDDVKAQVCDLAVGNLTTAEWRGLVPGLPYRAPCPA